MNAKSLFFVSAAALWLAPAFCLSGATAVKSFASPEESVRALATAVNSRDSNALMTLFGPAVEEIRSPDPVQAKNEVAEFAERLKTSNRIERISSSRCILEIGEDRWPFAIPIVQKGGSWSFDTESGKEEIINRRIGHNELDTLKSVRAYVDAQRDYARKDRDGDAVLEYAQKIASSGGLKDGLYWPPSLDGELSPLGPLVAVAQGKGYLRNVKSNQDPEPFGGYFFKILTRQGKSAPGGKYDYIINGNMIAGFALLAWPADYGNSGVMTFIVNQQGKIYQKKSRPEDRLNRTGDEGIRSRQILGSLARLKLFPHVIPKILITDSLKTNSPKGETIWLFATMYRPVLIRKPSSHFFPIT